MANPIDFGNGYVSEDWQRLGIDDTQTALIRHNGQPVGYVKLEFAPWRMFLCSLQDDSVITEVSGVQDSINYLTKRG